MVGRKRAPEVVKESFPKIMRFEKQGRICPRKEGKKGKEGFLAEREQQIQRLPCGK